MGKKKDLEELSNVATRINEIAMDMIGDYQLKKYGSSPKGMDYQQQMDDFYNIVEQVSAYLMGNALSFMDEEMVDDEIRAHMELIRNVTAYIRKEVNHGGMDINGSDTLPN